MKKQLRNYHVTVDWHGRSNDVVNTLTTEAYSVYEAKQKALAYYTDKHKAYEPYVVMVDVGNWLFVRNQLSNIRNSSYGVALYNKDNAKIENLAKLEALYIKVKKQGSAFWHNKVMKYVSENVGKIFVVNDSGGIMETHNDVMGYSYSIGGNINDYSVDRIAGKEVVHDDTILRLDRQHRAKAYRVSKVRLYLENCFFNYLDKYAGHICLMDGVSSKVVNVIVNNRSYSFKYSIDRGYATVEIIFWPEDDQLITLVYGRE